MKLVIIGGGHGAAQCIASLRMAKFEGEITLISDEDMIPYQRPPLSKAYLLGDLTSDRLPILRQTAYDNLGVTLKLGKRAKKINRAEKSVELNDGEQVPYDKLVIATGGRARRLSVEGSHLKGIHAVRTVADIDTMETNLSTVENVVIVGGGYIGLEAASALRKLGKSVTVLEAADRVLARVVAPQVSAFYEELHRKNDVDIVTSAGLKAYEGDDEVKHVILSDGRALPADLVIEGVGMIPNDELAKESGIETSDKGILVDQRCATTDPDIFAIGDVTDHENLFMGKRLRLESVQNAVDQAKTAIANALGGDESYNALPWFWSEQFGLKLQIAGLALNYDHVVQLGDPAEPKVSFLYMQGDQLVAADCIANTGDFMAAKKLIEQKKPLPADKLAEASSLKELAASLA